jgi:hypothetical protein
MTCIGLDYYNKNQQWIESVLNDHGNRALSLVLHLKYWKIENFAINLSKFWLCTLNPCVVTKFRFIAHVLLLTAHRS